MNKLIKAIEHLGKAVNKLTITASETEKQINAVAEIFHKHKKHEQTRTTKNARRVQADDRAVTGRNITPVP